MMLGLSIAEVAAAVQGSYDQVQKIEKGEIRASSTRLVQFSGVLDVPVAFFFDDTDPVKAAPAEETRDGSFTCERETIELLDTFFAIGDTKQRKALLVIAKALAHQ
jgi:transcriptional regulator with XRE-family HTH domain